MLECLKLYWFSFAHIFTNVVNYASICDILQVKNQCSHKDSLLCTVVTTNYVQITHVNLFGKNGPLLGKFSNFQSFKITQSFVVITRIIAEI